MKPALILAALLAGTASAQVADKAAHAGVSAVIGTVAREATDNSISEITREEYFIRSDSSRVQEIGSYARAALKDTE